MMHTKGPWKMLHLPPYRLISVVGGQDNPGMEDGTSVIAEIKPSAPPFSALYPDEIEANARLIAAAPELLQRLEDARNAIASLDEDALGYAPGDFDIGVNPWPLKDELLYRIDEAIHKAKGD